MFYFGVSIGRIKKTSFDWEIVNIYLLQLTARKNIRAGKLSFHYNADAV